MSISVEENLHRCFKKFGPKVADLAAYKRTKWQGGSPYPARVKWSDKARPETAEKA